MAVHESISTAAIKHFKGGHYHHGTVCRVIPKFPERTTPTAQVPEFDLGQFDGFYVNGTISNWDAL